MLEHLQEMQADGIFEKLDVLRLFPILKVLEVVDKRGVLEEATLGQEV